MDEISPDLFMDAVLAYQQTAAIKAALDLDLFSEIGKGNQTAESLARTTGAAVRGIRILCDYLTAAISKNTWTSIGSPNLRRHSWTGAPLRGWAASSSNWPRQR
jgi:hypothetical protein